MLDKMKRERKTLSLWEWHALRGDTNHSLMLVPYTVVEKAFISQEKIRLVRDKMIQRIRKALDIKTLDLKEIEAEIIAKCK